MAAGPTEPGPGGGTFRCVRQRAAASGYDGRLILRDPGTRALFLILPAILLAGCKPPERPAVTSIVGAVLLDGTGGPPISDSVVTIENGRIRAAGARASLLVPPEAEKIDGAGRFIVPGLIDVAQSASLSGGVRVVRPGEADAVLDQARQDHRPLLAEVSSLREARTMVDRGATGFLHMIRDQEVTDAALVARLRDLRIVFVPMLATESRPAELALAKRNTRRLADGGVLMAMGSGGDPYREMELMVEAGLTPSEVLVASTQHGARALATLDQAGTLEPGKRADLMLLSANPAEDIRNVRKIDRVMRGGVWIAGAR